MRFIETRVHGYLDYLMGLLLVASPWIFDYARGGAETLIPVLIGISVIIYSLLTDYELGVSPQLSMRTHLTQDMLGGALLAVSPWLFGFEEYVWQPHLVIGLLEIGAATFTKTYPQAERRHHGRTPRAQH